jgi:hypothetical protein
MRRAFIGIACAIVGYIGGALGGALLVTLFATPKSDKSVEAAMTGAFFTGPLVAIVACIAGIVLSKKKGVTP